MNPVPYTIPRGAFGLGGKIRVLVVDDSVVIRHLLQQALQEDPAIECVGAEPHGLAALERIPVLKPDVVTLDIEMPEMDGIATLREIRKRHPRLRTIMFSTLTTRGAAATFEALSSGADDYVTKAANAGSLDRSLESLRRDLIPKIKQFFTVAAPSRPAVGAPSRLPVRTGKPQVLAIGVSTGGPQALAELVPKIPAGFPLPILIVQHMPPMFTRLLAERLQTLSPLKVQEAVEGAPVTAGRVYVAPGDYHLRVRRSGPGHWITSLDQTPHENSCRPSVDVLFRSLAESYGGDVLSVVLTGMGRDGLLGVTKLKAGGASCIVQDEASSVVWGMPGAVAGAGLADCILPLDQIPAEIVRRTSGVVYGRK
jgi:two-component system, chemotaxis family, protein-glutamate methylesterase/glutaminase